MSDKLIIKTAEQRKKEREAVYANERKMKETRVIQHLNVFMNKDIFEENVMFEMTSSDCPTCPDKTFFVKLQAEIGCVAPSEKDTNTTRYICEFKKYGETRQWFTVKEQ